MLFELKRRTALEVVIVRRGASRGRVLSTAGMHVDLLLYGVRVLWPCALHS